MGFGDWRSRLVKVREHLLDKALQEGEDGRNSWIMEEVNRIDEALDATASFIALQRREDEIR